MYGLVLGVEFCRKMLTKLEIATLYKSHLLGAVGGVTCSSQESSANLAVYVYILAISAVKKIRMLFPFKIGLVNTYTKTE